MKKTKILLNTKKQKIAVVKDGKIFFFDERWITINGDDEDGNGQHVLIKENGDIVAGLGGHFKNLRDLGKKKPVTVDDLESAWKDIMRNKNVFYQYGRLADNSPEAIKERAEKMKGFLEKYIKLKDGANPEEFEAFTGKLKRYLHASESPIHHNPEKMLDVLLNGESIDDTATLHTIGHGLQKAKTAVGVQRYLKKLGARFDAPKNLEEAKFVAEGIEAVYKRYPFLAKVGVKIREATNGAGMFGTSDALDDDTYACCSPWEIKINPTLFNNVKKLQQTYERDVKSGFHAKGTDARSVVVHEIGHNIHDALNDAFKRGDERIGGRQSVEDYIYYDVCKFTDKTTQGEIERNLSRYGAKNHKEFFAEAMAEALCSPSPRPIAKKVLAEADKLMREASKKSFYRY